MASDQRPATSDLLRRHCLPCEGGTPPMARSQAKELLERVPGWRLVEGEPLKLARQVKLKDFAGSMGLVNKIAELAESEGHHPDICISWNRVKLELTTHSIKGLSENDFIMAAKVNELVEGGT